MDIRIMDFDTLRIEKRSQSLKKKKKPNGRLLSNSGRIHISGFMMKLHGITYDQISMDMETGEHLQIERDQDTGKNR